MFNLEQKVREVESKYFSQLDRIEHKVNKLMTAIDDLQTAVNDAIAEIGALVTQIQAALNNGDVATVEKLASSLETAVTNAKTTLNPPAPTPTPAPGV